MYVPFFVLVCLFFHCGLVGGRFLFWGSLLPLQYCSKAGAVVGCDATLLPPERDERCILHVESWKARSPLPGVG